MNKAGAQCYALIWGTLWIESRCFYWATRGWVRLVDASECELKLFITKSRFSIDNEWNGFLRGIWCLHTKFWAGSCEVKGFWFISWSNSGPLKRFSLRRGLQNIENCDLKSLGKKKLVRSFFLKIYYFGRKATIEDLLFSSCPIFSGPHFDGDCRRLGISRFKLWLPCYVEGSEICNFSDCKQEYFQASSDR